MEVPRLDTGEVWGPPILVGGRLRVTSISCPAFTHQISTAAPPAARTKTASTPCPWALEKPAGTSALSDTKARGERRAGSSLLLAAHEESQENHKEKEQQPIIPSSLTSYEVSLRVLLCLLNKCRSFPGSAVPGVRVPALNASHWLGDTGQVSWPPWVCQWSRL